VRSRGTCPGVRHQDRSADGAICHAGLRRGAGQAVAIVGLGLTRTSCAAGPLTRDAPDRRTTQTHLVTGRVCRTLRVERSSFVARACRDRRATHPRSAGPVIRSATIRSAAIRSAAIRAPTVRITPSAKTRAASVALSRICSRRTRSSARARLLGHASTTQEELSHANCEQPRSMPRLSHARKVSPLAALEQRSRAVLPVNFYRTRAACWSSARRISETRASRVIGLDKTARTFGFDRSTLE